MSGEGSARVRPVRPTDPVQLGPYRILGRLGEGGMGLVYLAESPGSRRVALKVIRDDLADEEFRRRFKSEVARARQVPPFCTAEVIDADTEHDPPYLVVEYVDGPSLSAVVADKGPLTPANQQGLAVGVAVALTAIHGAGVIHRDLKPSNVLLAPGSPKVIDFGIARATAGTDFETRTNQMVGTVSYMAPERFDGKTVTPAADIFAWGALVAYAGTGRTPFAADTPAATAMRIMTGQPDLEGLSGPLREMVEWTLAKNPAERPEARDLLDHLLAGGTRSPTRPASFVQQPEVLAAAGFAGLGGNAAPPSGPTVIVPALPTPGPAPTHPAAAATVAHGPIVPPEPATVRMTPVPAAPTAHLYPPVGPHAMGPPPVAPPTATQTTSAGPPPSRRGLRLAITALALAVLLLSASVAAFLTGVLPINREAAGTPTSSTAPPTLATTPPTSGPTTTPAATGPAVPLWLTPESRLLWRESLKAPGRWIETSIPRYDASCTLGGALRVELGDPSAGSYKCTGIKDTLTNFTVVVDVVLHGEGSCAGVWFRFSVQDGGYVFTVCRDQVQLFVHNNEGFTQLDSAYPQPALPIDRKIRIAAMGDGDTLRLFVGGEMLLETETTDAVYPSGRVVLGVLPRSAQAEAPYRVSFTDVEVYRAPN
jgi:eukaryotic-like serine/threonine-protein kinase